MSKKIKDELASLEREFELVKWENLDLKKENSELKRKLKECQKR